MCYRIESKPVREGPKKGEKKEEKEMSQKKEERKRGKEKTCTICWRIKSSGGEMRAIPCNERTKQFAFTETEVACDQEGSTATPVIATDRRLRCQPPAGRLRGWSA
jgi:hypothetical protein